MSVLRKTLVVTSCAVALTALSALAYGQATWSTQVVIPDLLTIKVPTTVLSFAPGQNLVDGQTAAALTGSLEGPNGCPVASAYPPPTFPACYPLDQPDAALPVQVFSNIRGPWSLLLDVTDLTSESDATRIPADQIWYRVNGGAWQRIGAASNPLYLGSGVTDGYLELELQFLLEVNGAEHAGSFTTNAVVSAIRQQ